MSLMRRLLYLILCLCVLLFSLWLGMAWFIHLPFGTVISCLFLIMWAWLSLIVLKHTWQKPTSWQRRLYGLIGLTGIIWFFSLEAQQDRDWQPDVDRILEYQLQDSKLTLHNVRNFDWRSETEFTERWETRQYDLNHISGVNVIASYWMGAPIAHTLISFDFKDQAPLVFSIEIRKEQNESFSAIGGFFRQFELSLIAADEKDIVYTRSNVRGEQVYFFPIQGLSQIEMQNLLLQYLAKSDSLKAEPQWYNTLLSNCTTIIYDLAKPIAKNELPMDYRILASGYLPNYLHDLKALNQDWDMKTWYQKAHVNPRVMGKELDSDEYSELIREGLPVAN